MQERFLDFLASGGGRLNGRGLLFGEAKVSLAILYPYWTTRVSCRPQIYAEEQVLSARNVTFDVS